MVSQREIRTGGYVLIKPPVPYDNCVLNVKAVVAAFNQEKALVGAFSVITNLRMELFEALIIAHPAPWQH